jgi:transposase
MKQNTTAKKNPKVLSKTSKQQLRKQASQQRLTIGLDLGDRHSRYCILDEAGEVVSEGSLPTTKTGLNSLFEKMPSSRVALEVGTHSPWASRHLAELGHEVIVANPHQVKLITQSTRKNDRIDAQKLARLARVDPQLLSPIQHRGEQAQADLAVIRGRAALVESRTGLINCARGTAKAMGERLKQCDADQVNKDLAEGLGEAVRTAIGPLLQVVETTTEQIGACDRQIEEIAKRYPEWNC